MRAVQTFLVLLIIIGTSCKGRHEIDKGKVVIQKPYPHNIDIVEGFKNPTELKLSVIADSIKYIVLSKEKDVLIKAFPSLIMSKNEFYISISGQLFRFNLSGKLLNPLGQIGRGPEEYLAGSQFAISPSSSMVYVKRNYLDDYSIYDSSGHFIKKISLLKSKNVFDFTCFSDSIFMYTFQYFGRFKEENNLKDIQLCSVFNTNRGTIATIKLPSKDIPSKIDYKRFLVPPPVFTFFNNDIVLSYKTDTIYKITGNSIYPGFIFNWGNLPHNQTFEELYYTSTESGNKVRNYGLFFEIPNKAYFTIKNVNEYYLFEYDKYTGVTKSSLRTEDDFGFVNDIDGGAKYNPKWTNLNGDIWITYDDAYDFKKMHNEDYLSKSFAVYPKRKEDLREFLENLNIDDNPVLKLVYLKRIRD